MNVAEATLNYYESEDFRNNYAELLMQDRDAIEKRIHDLLKARWGKVCDMYGVHMWLNDDQLEEVYDYILDNIDDFTCDYTGYYVGSGGCIDSVGFGEQEEQLTGIYNHDTKGEYSLEEMQKQFEEAGFYVSGEYAYYSLEGDGVWIDLFAEEIPVLREIVESYKPKKYDRSTYEGEVIEHVINHEGTVKVYTKNKTGVFYSDLKEQYTADYLLCDIQDEEGINVSKY